jgi:hypothetical protein
MIIRLNNSDLSELNPTHGEVYLIPYYVIIFVSDRSVVCFLRGTLGSSTNTTDRQDVTEILLTVALFTLSLT